MIVQRTAAPTGSVPPDRHAARPFIPRMIRTFAVPIILGWLVTIAVLNVTVPQLETVGQIQAVSMSPDAAPSMISMKHIGKVFEEGDSDSAAMIVLEGQRPLGDAAHAFYDQMIGRLQADTTHVQSLQDFWGDPLTATGAQSSDGKAAYVQVKLAGNQGESLANESVEAVKTIVERLAPPPGVKVYVTGSAALVADQQQAGDRSLQVIEAVTFTVIIVMLLLVYRSIITSAIMLTMVVLGLLATRGGVAFLGFHRIIGLSTFATNLLVVLAIAAATDYAIFLIGRYQEARGLGQDRESAYYTMFGGTAHVVLGSGLTIAGATFCLSFTRLPYFQTLGVPLAIGMVIVVAAALTLGPAIIAVTSRFGKLLEPKRMARVRGWRKVGAAIVRWPGPILVGAVALALVGLLTLPGYRTNYNDRNYLPADLPANEGYAAAERHFSQARMNPEVLMVESDHDMRNSADFLVINKIAKAIFAVEGISRVQAITRPDGKPIEHTSIPFLISMQGTSQKLTEKYNQDLTARMLEQVNDIQSNIDQMERMHSLTQQMADVTHEMVIQMTGMVVDVEELRNHIADFDDFFRPIRSYFYWEKHCYDIPVCWSLRSVFDKHQPVQLDTQDVLPDQHRQPERGAQRQHHGADDDGGRDDAAGDDQHDDEDQAECGDSGDHQVIGVAVGQVLEHRRGTAQVDRGSLQRCALDGFLGGGLDLGDARDARLAHRVAFVADDEPHRVPVRREELFQAALEVGIVENLGRQIERVVVARSIKGFAHRRRILLHRGHLILQPFLGGMHAQHLRLHALHGLDHLGHHRGQLGHERVQALHERQQVVDVFGHDVDSVEGRRWKPFSSARCPITICAAAAPTSKWSAGKVPAGCGLLTTATGPRAFAGSAKGGPDRMSAFAGMFPAIPRPGNTASSTTAPHAIATACLQRSARRRASSRLFDSAAAITNPGHAWASAMERSGLLECVAGLDEQPFGEFTADKLNPDRGSSRRVPRRQADGGIATHVERGGGQRQSGGQAGVVPQRMHGFPALAMQDRLIHHGEQTQNRIAQAFRVRFCVCSPT